MNYSALISALITVESGGQDMAIGDGNRAIGSLQIHKGVVEDVNRFSGTHYTHNQMTNRVAARLEHSLKTAVPGDNTAQRHIRALRRELSFYQPKAV